MKIIFFYLIAFQYLLSGCSISFNKPAKTLGLPLDPATKTVVLIDGGLVNTPGLAIVKKRESVVKDVKNQYLIMLSLEMQKQLRLNIISDTTLTEYDKKKLLDKDPGTTANINQRYNNAIVMILKDCYGGFRQGGVDKIESFDGSVTRRAHYSVFFDTEWIIVQGNNLNERSVAASEYHSERNVQSGLLARGPGFQANKKNILEMAEKNAFKVAQLFKY